MATDDSIVQRFYTWVPSTEDFSGHDRLDDATKYAHEYGDYGGPCYVFELKELVTNWPEGTSK